jgi:hypothetical protein
LITRWWAGREIAFFATDAEGGKARALAAMRAGRQRRLEDMRAKKAAGKIERFPGGRKSGAGWVTPRMWSGGRSR